MTRVGIRELRQRASELLRLVEQGDTIEITDRGRPVAVLGPIPTGSPLERLRRTGEIEPAIADFEDAPDPLPSQADRLPSEVLAGLRNAER